jgi:cytidylate kinase
MRKIIVAIDGWSSCGKSTMARQLASKLNYLFIDSGAMYRAITLFFSRNSIDLENMDDVKKALSKINLEFVFNNENGNTEICLNQENVENVIRNFDIAARVSEVASNSFVREFAVEEQQKIGKGKGIVMDGRDIGTTVFPDAELKIFVTADIKTRVLRRYKELVLKNPEITLDEVQHNLETRDYMDSNREISPLLQADDALLLDNTNLTPTEQLEMVLSWATAKING